VPVFVLVIDRRFIAREERFMAAAHGEAYEAYRERVRRWL
jgi:protein-S-isoprenylcysteine O-methyltransferase Ste14